MTQRRVVITGMGAISALGPNHQLFWERLSSGLTGIAPIQQVECAGMRFQKGAEVKDYNPCDYFEPRQLSMLDRFAQFALISAKEAVSDSKLDAKTLGNAQTAVITGSCVGGKNTEDRAFYRYYHENTKRTHPTTIPNIMANAGASHIASTFGITGPTYTISTACASSSHAIGQAFWMIRQGLVQRAIAGGSEAPFSPGHLSAWEGLRVVSSDTCRPFSKGRSGMILGEGGAMLVLESLDSALERKAPIYAELLGFGMSADASHLTDPNAAGQVQAMNAALTEAGIAPSSVDYINAHGTGTQTNDEVESTTINTVFPNATNHLLISSTKGAHGHLLGATGALETIATALAIKHQLIPPTLNFLEQDPVCDIPLVVNESRPREINYALSASYAFGGLNAILALGHYND